MSPPPAKRARGNGHGNQHFFKRKGLVENGQRGFLATCNYQEKECIRECYNLLAHYANFIYGAESVLPPLPPDTENEVEALMVDDDISDELQREITVAQQQNCKPKKARFLALDTGAINTVFIRTTLTDPVHLAWFIVRDIYNTGFKRTRALIRLIPIEVVCSACNVRTIANAVQPIFDKYFTKQPCSYSIVVNRRLNNSVDRDTIIRTLAGAVQEKNPWHRVDLRNPDKTVVVEIIKGVCMIGVLPGYFKYKKYNLLECARPRNGLADDDNGNTTSTTSSGNNANNIDLDNEPPANEAAVEEDGSDEEPEPVEPQPNDDSSDDDMNNVCDEPEEDQPPQVALTDSPDSPEDEHAKVNAVAVEEQPKENLIIDETPVKAEQEEPAKNDVAVDATDKQDNTQKPIEAEEAKEEQEKKDVVEEKNDDKQAEDNS